MRVYVVVWNAKWESWANINYHHQLPSLRPRGENRGQRCKASLHAPPKVYLAFVVLTAGTAARHVDVPTRPRHGEVVWVGQVVALSAQCRIVVVRLDVVELPHSDACSNTRASQVVLALGVATGW